jgi:hypothetical protein
MEPKAQKLPSAPKGAQDADAVTHKSGDPNIAGWAPTTDTINPMSGEMDAYNDNDDYKRFLLVGKSPVSVLGADHGDPYSDHNPPQVPASVTRRDGGEHSGWGVASGSQHSFGAIDPASSPADGHPGWDKP